MNARKARDIFVAAAKLSPGLWDAYLDEACAGDVELRRRVSALLASHREAGSFLAAPAAAAVAAREELPATESPGVVIGPYKLTEQIGEGGMGLVFVAEQQQPVRRKVALKVLKPGMDTRQVIARFEAERQALALLEHPNIAKVFDGGTTESGRPFFVMELVKGVPITDYCDEHKLAPRERLELFVSLCRAVQHAHHKGIIHRDLKPSNVLVASHDGTPVVKVIDFGVAKAVGEPLTDKAVCTHATQLVGTPLYMSPEQAGLSGLDIDTRTDIYSLGVLLYELLTGTTPFDGERLRKAGFDEIRRIIREEDPARPSTRFSTLGQATATGSANRRSDPKQLSRQIRGELDWIVMKALEKDRNRRYESASAFAADVQRYLADEPVQAGPPGAGYRLRKFVKRHRGPVLAASVVLMALVAGIVGTTAGLVEAWRQQDLKEQARKDAETNAGKAREETAKAKTEKDRAEGLLYVSQITLAQHAWESNDVALALRYLDACSRDYRGWEHDYLFTLLSSHQRTFRGHTEGVSCVALSPDGKRIASGSVDRMVRVWDVGTGQDVLTLKGHPLATDATLVASMAFSPDGLRLATANRDGTVRIWDAATGEETRTVGKFSHMATSVAWSPDGKRLVGGSGGATVKVWDADTGAEVLDLPSGSVYSVAWSPDGKRLAVAHNDSSVRVWDAGTGEELRTLRGHKSPAWSVAWSPDGRRLVSGSMDQTVKVWDADAGRELRTLRGHTDQVRSVAWNPDGTRVVSGSDDNSLKEWDASTGVELRTLRGHADKVFSVAVTPDGQDIVSCSADHTVKVWGPAAGRELLTPGGSPPSIFCLALSRDGRRIVTGCWEVADNDNTVKVWDAVPGTGPRTLRGHAGQITCVAVSADGRRIVSGSGDKTVNIWDEATGYEKRSLRGHANPVQAVALSADGRRIVSTDNTVKVWDADTGQETLTRRYVYSVYHVALSPDGKRIAASAIDTVRVWDADTGAETLTLQGHKGSVSSVAWSPNGRRIVSDGPDNTVRVWDAATGAELLALRGHTGAVRNVAVMPDGRRIVSGSLDRTVKVWDADTGQELLTLRGHPNFVFGLAVSPDGKRIFSICNGQVKVWDGSMSQPKP